MAEPMSDERLAELRRIADAATPGEWDYEDCEGVVHVNAGSARTKWRGATGLPARSWAPEHRILEYDLDTWDEGDDDQDDQQRHNAEHIAAFDPSTVLALLDRIKELEARLARVTDDSTSKALHQMFMRSEHFESGWEASLAVTEVLAMIRAVAADNPYRQEQTND